MDIPQGDLARAVNHEMNTDWPFSVEIVVYHGSSRKGKSRRVVITSDQFFGRGSYNAPMTGDQIIGIIDRMRRE